MACAGIIWVYQPFQMGWRSNRNIVICTVYRDSVISSNLPQLPGAKHRALLHSSSSAAIPALAFTKMTGTTLHRSLVLHTRPALSRDRSTFCLAMKARALYAAVTQSAICMTGSQRSLTFWEPEPPTLG